MARTASKATLTPSKVVTIDMLATGSTPEDVEKAIGNDSLEPLTAEKVRAWLRDADFVAALNVRTNEVRDAHLERLRAMVPKALDTLEGLLESQDEAVRLRVASYVLKAAALDSVPWQRIDQTKPEYVRNKWQREETFNALF
jgi:hypothetical protein